MKALKRSKPVARVNKRAAAGQAPVPESTFGPSWSEMTDRQRELYPHLPQAELDALWGETPDTEGGPTVG